MKFKYFIPTYKQKPVLYLVDFTLLIVVIAIDIWSTYGTVGSVGSDPILNAPHTLYWPDGYHILVNFAVCVVASAFTLWFLGLQTFIVLYASRADRSDFDDGTAIQRLEKAIRNTRWSLVQLVVYLTCAGSNIDVVLSMAYLNEDWIAGETDEVAMQVKQRMHKWPILVVNLLCSVTTLYTASLAIAAIIHEHKERQAVREIQRQLEAVE